LLPNNFSTRRKNTPHHRNKVLDDPPKSQDKGGQIKNVTCGVYLVINADKPLLWKDDVAASVDLYNEWFLGYAPRTYRETRIQTITEVKNAFDITNHLSTITPSIIKASPEILFTLRMCTAPPIARDRLIGLSYIDGNLVHALERGKIPPRMNQQALQRSLESICNTINKLLDRDIFQWIDNPQPPEQDVHDRAAMIIADRLCGSQSDPLIRNAQEKRQLASIKEFLEELGYKEEKPVSTTIQNMKPGTFYFRLVVTVEEPYRVQLPIDAVIQPHKPRKSSIPILMEAKSAGDYTNTNKRRKEEATKNRQLTECFGNDGHLLLFLCGYFNTGYLGYEAAEGLDWVWEHRIADMKQLGL
jgi:hypothetical protein